MARADARVDEHLAGRVREADGGPQGVPAGAGENLAAAAPEEDGAAHGPGLAPEGALAPGGEAPPIASDDPEGSEPMSLEEGREDIADELNY